MPLVKLSPPITDAIGQLRAFAREHLHGRCKMLSEGKCKCNLCAVDLLAVEICRLQSESHELEQELQTTEELQWQERREASADPELELVDLDLDRSKLPYCPHCRTNGHMHRKDCPHVDAGMLHHIRRG